MTKHADFLNRLIYLVEYAETHNLPVAALALGAAAEIIAPILHKGEGGEDEHREAQLNVHRMADCRKY